MNKLPQLAPWERRGRGAEGEKVGESLLYLPSATGSHLKSSQFVAIAHTAVPSHANVQTQEHTDASGH